MPPAGPNKSAARQLQEQREHSLREREAQSRRVDETRAANMSAAAKAAAAMVRKAGAERDGAAVASRQATVGLPAGASPATPAKEAYGNRGSVRRSISSSSKEGFAGGINRSSGASDTSRGQDGSGLEGAKRDSSSSTEPGRTLTMRSVASVASVASAASAAPGRAARGGSGRPNGASGTSDATGNGARAAASAWKKPQDTSATKSGVAKNNPAAGVAAAQASKNTDPSGEDAEFKRRSAAAAARMSSQKKIDIAPRASTRDSMLANFSDALKWLKDDEETGGSSHETSAMASALASSASGASGAGSGTGSGTGSGPGSGPGSHAGSATASVAGSVAASGAASTASRNSQDAPRQAARQSAHVAIPQDQRQPVAGDGARNALAAATLAKTNVDATVGMINDRVNERINKRNRKLKMYQPSAVWTGYDPLREASRNEQRDQGGALLPAAQIVSGGQQQQSQPRDVWPPPPDDTEYSSRDAHHHTLHMPQHHHHKQVFAAPNEIVSPRPRPLITLTNENLDLPRPRTHSPAVRPRSLGAPSPDLARTPPTPNGALFPSEPWLPLYQAARSAENLAVPDHSPFPQSPQAAEDDASRQRYSFEGYFRPPDPVQSQQHHLHNRLHLHHKHHHHRGGRILGRVLRPSHRRTQSSTSDSRDHSGEGPAVPAMKATMRDANKTRQRFNEDKPWKHHTHATALTERERKRYEGVWATNKGTYVKYLYVAPSPSSPVPPSPSPNNDHDSRTGLPAHRPPRDPADQVHAIAVRDIWRRSRLSDETLEHIWDLVDHNYDGTLDRPSFVVGMWLVDQCLYGRKLPAKIDQTIWNSVALLHVDVKVKAKKKQAHRSGADDKSKREGRPKTRSKHK